MGKRAAQRAARRLWVVAEDAIHELETTTMMENAPPANGQFIHDKLFRYVMACLPALHFEGGDLPIEIALRAVSDSIDGLLDLCAREEAGQPVPEPHRTSLGHYYRRLVTDEPLARQHLGLPPVLKAVPEPTTAELVALMVSLQRQGEATAQDIRALKGAQEPKVGLLFSAAADRYHDEMARTRGAHHDDLKAVRHRRTVFIAICCDRPITDYTAGDIQHFMNKVRFLAPNLSKRPGYDIGRVLDYIADAEESGLPGLAQSTLVNNYVAKIKTIIKAACDEADLPHTLGGRRLKVPKGVPKPKAKFIVDEEAANRLFGAATQSGLLAETMLPLLGYLTGRRLGLLAFLQGEDIRQHDGVWVVTPREIVRNAEGGWVAVPYKTGESLTAFVLHDLLVRIGFVEWARTQPGFVFTSLHEARDPADTASKRMCRLFDKAAIDRSLYKMFHGLRHAKINRDRDLGIESRTTRLQVGHELLDVHDVYGGPGMRRTERHTVAYAELPPGIDFSVFEGLDYDALSAARSNSGRPVEGGLVRGTGLSRVTVAKGR